MDLIEWVHIFVPILVVGSVVLLFFALIVPEVKEQMTIESLDETCFKLEKIKYCDSIGMEFGSIVVTPSGIFGGSPYNKEACVTKNSEKIIEFNDLNWKKCKQGG